MTDRGHVVAVAATGMAGLEQVVRDQPDVVLLDLGLPDVDGMTVLSMIRATSQVPVIVITARDDAAMLVQALDAGADDYVTKPFRLAELLARARALLRRGNDPVPPHSPVKIDVQARRVWFRGEELHLTVKEFDLFRILVREQGKVVTREQLMKEIWETPWFGSTKTLDMHISVLRRKIGDDASNPMYISTVRGLGFRFDTPAG
jgi:DNA-binding response OmpR family regulator